MFATKAMRDKIEADKAAKRKAIAANANRIMKKDPMGLRKQVSDATSAKLVSPVKNQPTMVEGIMSGKTKGITYHSQNEVNNMRKNSLSKGRYTSETKGNVTTWKLKPKKIK